MGRLYTKYYNTLKRMRVRDIHQEFTQETTLIPAATLHDDATSMMAIATTSSSTTSAVQINAMMSASSTSSSTTNANITSATTILGNSSHSNNNNNNIVINSSNNDDVDNGNSNNSINTQIELIEDEFQELIQLDDTSVSAIKNFLRCQGLDWNDVKTMWAKTYLARQEDVEHSTIKDVLQQWPKYLNARGMELVGQILCQCFLENKLKFNLFLSSSFPSLILIFV